MRSFLPTKRPNKRVTKVLLTTYTYQGLPQGLVTGATGGGVMSKQWRIHGGGACQYANSQGLAFLMTLTPPPNRIPALTPPPPRICRHPPPPVVGLNGDFTPVGIMSVGHMQSENIILCFHCDGKRKEKKQKQKKPSVALCHIPGIQWIYSTHGPTQGV